jgi:hypothetical protein
MLIRALPSTAQVSTAVTLARRGTCRDGARTTAQRTGRQHFGPGAVPSCR